MPHVTTPLDADPSCLLCHWPSRSAAQMFVMVSLSQVTHPLCIDTHKYMCVCFVILLSCSLCCLPLAGHDTDRGTPVSSTSIFSPEKNNVLLYWYEPGVGQRRPQEVKNTLTRAEIASDLNFPLSKSEGFFSAAQFETRPPRV